MGAYKKEKIIFQLVLATFLAMACSRVEIAEDQNGANVSGVESGDRVRPPTITSTERREKAEVIPTPTVVPDTGWRALRTGLEQRRINLTDNGIGRLWFESIYLLRVNPDYFRFDVGYEPGNPLSLAEWQERTGALIVVNGGFFTETFEATGIIVSEGRHSGVSYQNFGGMLVVTPEGPELRWLPGQPYDSSEQMLAGLQSFPMLVHSGGKNFYTDADKMRARRTVVAQDRLGRFLFIIATMGGFSLDELSRFLVQSDLDIDRALNLDGGASSGLKIAGVEPGIDAFSLLPAVITVYPSR